MSEDIKSNFGGGKGLGTKKNKKNLSQFPVPVRNCASALEAATVTLTANSRGANIKGLHIEPNFQEPFARVYRYNNTVAHIQ